MERFCLTVWTQSYLGWIHAALQLTYTVGRLSRWGVGGVRDFLTSGQFPAVLLVMKAEIFLLPDVGHLHLRLWLKKRMIFWLFWLDMPVSVTRRVSGILSQSIRWFLRLNPTKTWAQGCYNMKKQKVSTESNFVNIYSGDWGIEYSPRLTRRWIRLEGVSLSLCAAATEQNGKIIFVERVWITVGIS